MPVLGYLKESTCCSLDVSAAQIFRELGFPYKGKELAGPQDPSYSCSLSHL